MNDSVYYIVVCDSRGFVRVRAELSLSDGHVYLLQVPWHFKPFRNVDLTRDVYWRVCLCNLFGFI